jgi:hypothetical protein
MRILLLVAAAFFVLTTSTVVHAEVQLRIRMGLPTVLPPLVEVRPGLQVVQDYDDEIFFADGYYWMQRDGSWYRARDYRQRWSFVRPGGESRMLFGHQPGQYRRYQHDERRVWPDPDRRHTGRHWGEGEHRGGSREWRQPERRHGEGRGEWHGEGRGEGHGEGHGNGRGNGGGNGRGNNGNGNGNGGGRGHGSGRGSHER